MEEAALLVIAALGCLGCAAAFKDEYQYGKFHLSLLVAAVGWAIVIALTLALWRD